MSAALSPATVRAVARIVTKTGRTARFAMRGRSMLPLLRAPMVLEVAPLRHRAHVGDVIVFPLGDAHVAHRVIDFAGDRYIASGDANPRVVERVAHVEVMGRVEAVWSDASPSAYRVDVPAHRLAGYVLARTHGLRRFFARAKGRVARSLRPRSSLRWRRHV